MGLRILLAFIVLFSIFAELAFDNTNSFVRVAAAAPELSITVVNRSDEAKVEQRTERAPKQAKATIVWSLGHYACPATSFVHDFNQTVHRLEPRFVWHYRYIDRFVLLRPPIQA